MWIHHEKVQKGSGVKDDSLSRGKIWHQEIQDKGLLLHLIQMTGTDIAAD